GASRHGRGDRGHPPPAAHSVRAARARDHARRRGGADADAARNAEAGRPRRAEGRSAVTRADAVARVASALPERSLTVACNGMIGRELFTCADRPSRFYMIGSMGLASSIGLGLALVQPAVPIVVFDGDGNVLMNLGTLGSIAAAGVANLYHLVFDNGA